MNRYIFWIKYRLKMLKIELRYHIDMLKKDRISLRRKVRYLFIAMLLRRCIYNECGCRGGWAYLAHSNCAYVEELRNYNFCCKECHDYIDSMYQDWWDEYNASRY